MGSLEDRMTRDELAEILREDGIERAFKLRRSRS